MMISLIEIKQMLEELHKQGKSIYARAHRLEIDVLAKHANCIQNPLRSYDAKMLPLDADANSNPHK